MLVGRAAVRGHRAGAARAARRAACSSRTTCASTTASSGASSRGSARSGAARSLCTVRLSRALYPGDAAPQSRRGHGASRHRDREPPSRHARCAGAAGSSGASCARRGRADELQRALDRRAACAPRCRRRCRPTWPTTCPKGPGVYRFFGAGRAGRRHSSICRQGEQPARARARSFSGRRAATRSRCRLAAQVRRVDWTETAGELGALLLEAREVRESQPVYNRQLRGGGERFTWLFDDGGARRELVELDARGAALRQCLRHLSRRARCAARARRASRANTGGASSC